MLSPTHKEIHRYIDWILEEASPVPSVKTVVNFEPRGKRNKLGHFRPATEGDTPNAWSSKEGELMHEIVVCKEALFGTPLEILAIVQHELAHMLNWEDGLHDVSKGGRHNAEFRDKAEEMNLVVVKAPRVGYTTTGFTDDFATRVLEEFVPDDVAFQLFGVELPEKPKRPSKSKSWHVPAHPDAPKIRTSKDLTGLVEYLGEEYVLVEA